MNDDIRINTKYELYDIWINNPFPAAPRDESSTRVTEIRHPEGCLGYVVRLRLCEEYRISAISRFKALNPLPCLQMYFFIIFQLRNTLDYSPG